MSQTLIGVFESYAPAQQAARDLMAAGIDRDDIRISRRESGSSTEEDKGFWESMKDALGFGSDDDDDRYGYQEASRRGGTVVSVDADEQQVPTVLQIMQRNGVMDLDERAREWSSSGWQGYKNYQAISTAEQLDADRYSASMVDTDSTTSQSSVSQTGATQDTAATRSQSSEQAIPVIKESLQVGKQTVQGGGVRIHSRLKERPVEEQVNLRSERVEVERRPVDRPATAADQSEAFTERVIEETEMTERPVVAKQARVVEEVALSKQVESHTETVRDTVRETDVEVERVEADERYRPAYDLADELSSNAAYRGREWTQVEPEARRSFETRHPGSKWDEVKDVVKSRYDRARAR